VRPTTALCLAFAACMGGCASSPLDSLENQAERQLERAEEVGVRDRDLEPIQRNFELAQDAEAAAEDADEATEDAAEAEERLGRARARHQAIEHELTLAAQRLAEVETELAPLERQLESQQARGLTIQEAETLAGSDLTLSRQRQRSLELEEEALGLRMRLAKLELEATESDAKAARARADIASQRATAAAALYELAREQARTLELERLAGQQEWIHRRMGEAAK
jgi:hypothetical protein